MVVNGQKEFEVEKDTNHSPLVMPYSPVLQILRKCNSFFMQGLRSLQGECRPLFSSGKQIGIISLDVAFHLMNYPSVFTVTPAGFYLNPQLDTYDARSEALDVVLRDMKAKGDLISLHGWRDECFNVWSDFGSEPLFKMERSGVTVLGVRAFGVHITGYTQRSDGSLAIWLQKRSATKATWPGMLDSMVGGGITAGLTPSEVAVKEAAEEATIPEDLMRGVVSAGAVSFFTETERGLHANTEFVYDLELPSTFVPKNSDGEVEGFELVPVEEYLSRVLSSKYKLTSAPIALDFLLRRGFLNPDNEPNIPAIQELLHVPLHQFYRQWPVQYVQSAPSSPVSFTTASAGSSGPPIYFKA